MMEITVGISQHPIRERESSEGLLSEEQCNTETDLESHLRSDHFGVLNGAMKLLHIEPDIRFNTISSTAGPEAIKRHGRDGRKNKLNKLGAA